MERPVIHIISLGGTIAMTPAKDGGGATAQLQAADLTAAIPEIEKIAELHYANPLTLGSANIKITDLIGVADTIDQAFKDGAAGVVITQGTDSMEETAFALDLMVSAPGPIVITGAMRNPSLHGADGPANLMAAIHVAASGKTVAAGVVVVMNDEIHATCYVQKLHTSNPSAFASPMMGPIGGISENVVSMFAKPAPLKKFDRKKLAKAIDVRLWWASLDSTEAELKAMANGADALVVAAFGGGHVAERHVATLGGLSQKMPVILASRTQAGQVLTSTYGYAGAEIDLQRRGLILAGGYHPLKARILTRFLIASGATRAEIASAFQN